MSYPALVYPHALPWEGVRPSAAGLHETAGLAHNVALDFMAHSGTFVLAPENATVFRWSGHDPRQGVTQGSVYGWSMYLHTTTGLVYYLTHLDRRYAAVGAKVKAGDLIGRVGRWPGDEPRSHTHMGITHPEGESFARAAILRVAKAPRVKARGSEST